MLTGYHPFDSYETEYSSYCFDSNSRNHQGSQFSDCSEIQREHATKRHIVDGLIEFEDPCWDNMSDAKRLISRLLIHNPDHRATAQQALRSVWIAEDLEELKGAYEARIAAIDDDGSC